MFTIFLYPSMSILLCVLSHCVPLWYHEPLGFLQRLDQARITCRKSRCPSWRWSLAGWAWLALVWNSLNTQNTCVEMIWNDEISTNCEARHTNLPKLTEAASFHLESIVDAFCDWNGRNTAHSSAFVLRHTCDRSTLSIHMFFFGVRRRKSFLRLLVLLSIAKSHSTSCFNMPAQC